VSSADFSRLTAIVHTCDRRGSVDRLIKSVGWACPQLRVLVADDSSKPQPVAGADLVKTPVGAGVSACRNTLLSRVRTPYFLLLEDGMELNRRSNVERLLELVSSNQLDIAAGDVVRCQRRLGLFTSRQPDPAHVTFEFESDTLRLVPGAASRGAPAPGALSCDVTHNFFVARTDKVRAIGGWDAQLQVDERIEFFFRACRFGLKVGVSPESIAWRWAEKASVRQPARDFTSLAIAKMGVSRLIDAEGRTHEAASHAQSRTA
jgi:hypothetical protein